LAFVDAFDGLFGDLYGLFSDLTTNTFVFVEESHQVSRQQIWFGILGGRSFMRPRLSSFQVMKKSG